MSSWAVPALLLENPAEGEEGADVTVQSRHYAVHRDNLYLVAAHGPEVVIVPDLAFSAIGRWVWPTPATSDDYVDAIGALDEISP